MSTFNRIKDRRISAPGTTEADIRAAQNAARRQRTPPKRPSRRSQLYNPELWQGNARNSDQNPMGTSSASGHQPGELYASIERKKQSTDASSLAHVLLALLAKQLPPLLRRGVGVGVDGGLATGKGTGADYLRLFGLEVTGLSMGVFLRAATYFLLECGTAESDENETRLAELQQLSIDIVKDTGGDRLVLQHPKWNKSRVLDPRIDLRNTQIDSAISTWGSNPTVIAWAQATFQKISHEVPFWYIDGRDLYDLFKDMPVILIYLYVSESERNKRVVARERATTGSEPSESKKEELIRTAANRDAADTTRTVGRLLTPEEVRQNPNQYDAIIDTSDLTPEEVAAAILVVVTNILVGEGIGAVLQPLLGMIDTEFLSDDRIKKAIAINPRPVFGGEQFQLLA